MQSVTEHGYGLTYAKNKLSFAIFQFNFQIWS